MSVSAITYAALGAAITCEVAGSALLQKSEQFTKAAPTLGMAARYGAAFFLMSVALKAMPLGVVCTFRSGVGIVVAAVVGALAFKQSLDGPAMVGMAMIVGGVVVMQAFSATTGN